MKKILIVEDNDVNREMLKRRLQRRGYEIIEAVNGLEAVTKAQTEQPNIILMDMSLPLLNGWDATKRLKSDSTTRKILIIGLTAHAMIEDKQRALEAGCDHYLTKPVEFQKLIEVLEQSAPATSTTNE